MSELLQRIRGLDGRDPFLFFARGRDWRWWSRARLVELAAQASAQLRSAAGRHPGRILFAARSEPVTAVLDLAALSTGAMSVPWPDEVPAASPAGPEAVWWLQGSRSESSGRFRSTTSWSFDARRVQSPAELTSVLGGGSAVGLLEGATWELADESSVIAWAESLGRVVSACPERRRRRGPEVTLTSLALQQPEQRLVTVWAAIGGHALAVAPADDWLRAFFFVRPTLLVGSLLRLKELNAAALEWVGKRAHPRKIRRALGRLSTFVLLGTQELPSSTDRQMWSERGVAIVPSPWLDPVGNPPIQSS